MSSSSSAGRPRPSASASGSSVPISLSSTSGGGFPVSSVPVDEPAPTQTGNGGDYKPIANSAALYLYTFLATLVLLLSVSAAIVIRSFILRRRHRRLVEEAIRNGTWVPPPPPLPGGARGPRVDLSKKPAMWDAYLGSHEKDGSYYHLDDPRDWDAIKPVSAAYLAPPPPPEAASAEKMVGDQSVESVRPRRTIASRVQAARVGMHSAMRWLVGLPPRRDYDSSASTSQVNLGHMGEGSLPGAGTMESKIPSSGPDGGPPIVRVSVIIAMPRPPKPRSSNEPRGSTSFSSIPPLPVPSSSTTLQHPLSPDANQKPSWQLSPDEEEEPLPVMEMGVTELVVVDHEAEERKAAAAMDAKPIGRDSVSITVEV